MSQDMRGSRRKGLQRCRLLCSAAAIVTVALSSSANAQSGSPAPTPPIHQNVDGNGVDTILDTFNISSTDVSIGANDRDGLAYRRYWNGAGGWRDSLAVTLTGDSYSVVVSIGGSSESFTSAGGTTFTSDQGTGSTLVLNGNYTYTTTSGTVVVFTPANGSYDRYVSNLGWATSITNADGTRWGFTYRGQNYCPFQPGDYEGTCPTARSVRLQSVTNNLGYQMKLTYASNTLTNADQVEAWQTITKVTAINNTVEACAPSADSCSLTGNWPSATYATTATASGRTETVTDALGRTKRYTFDVNGLMTGIRRPGATIDDVVVGYGTNGVSSVAVNGVSTSYALAQSGPNQTMTVTDALGHSTVVAAVTADGLPTSVTDALGHVTTYAYDGDDRLTRATANDGNYVQYAYDGRGNVTSKTSVAKSGSGLANIVTSASYSASCANALTCNKPVSITDANGNVTDYTYDATHGGVLTVTAPAATSGAARPQTRLSYTSYNGIWRQSGTSVCRTTANCVGGADETKASVTYTGGNLLATSASSGAGDGSLNATVGISYDNIGNRTSVDGPLAGSVDTTVYAYDADRELISVVSPDRDGSGPLKQREVVYHYLPNGLSDSTSVGTVDGSGNFTALQIVTTAYDTAYRKATQTLSAGGTTYSKVGYGYDAVGRLICTAQRMDPAQWNSQTDNCSPQTTGPNGPDRVEQRGYDAAGRLIAIASAFGTSAASTETMSYTPNGLIATARDANGNLTSYGYDGLDRLTHTVYPVYTPGQNASNGGDYEQLTYDANGNVTNRRLRDGQSIGYSYDALNRRTHEYNPNTNVAEVDVSYNYDLLGRLTSASDGNGWYNNFEYDALGRVTRQYGLIYGNRMQYDLAGMMTRQTWDDGLFVTYEHDNVGTVTAIRENGGPLLASYVYDDLGRRSSMVRGNGTSTSYSYDGASRLTQLTQDLAGTSNDLTLVFGYNPAGQILSRTSSNDTYSFTAGVNVDRGYTTNGLNQYTQSGTVAPVYDARGNLTQSGSQTYQYNTKNQLFRDSANNLIYHNPLGLLGQESGVDLDYVGDHVATEMSNGIARRYVYGPGDEAPILWYEGSGTGDKRYLHDDERGSVIAISDGSGNALAINRYDEFGIPQPGNLGRFQYTGQRWMPGLGMYDYKARVYSPTLGRFMQTDPIGYGDGMNWYNYVSGDPVNSVDPRGLTKSVTSDERTIPYNPGETKGECPDPSGLSCAAIEVTGNFPSNPIVRISATSVNGDGVGGGAASVSLDADIIVQAHAYRTDNKVCARALTAAERKDLLSRFAVPGHEGNKAQAGLNAVFVAGVFGGLVNTEYGNGGQTVINTTTALHLFTGSIVRTIYDSGNSTRIQTTGTGNFMDPGMFGLNAARDLANQLSGPIIFGNLDAAAASFAQENIVGC